MAETFSDETGELTVGGHLQALIRDCEDNVGSDSCILIRYSCWENGILHPYMLWGLLCIGSVCTVLVSQALGLELEPQIFTQSWVWWSRLATPVPGQLS